MPTASHTFTATSALPHERHRGSTSIVYSGLGVETRQSLILNLESGLVDSLKIAQVAEHLEAASLIRAHPKFCAIAEFSTGHRSLNIKIDRRCYHKIVTLKWRLLSCCFRSNSTCIVWSASHQVRAEACNRPILRSLKARRKFSCILTFEAQILYIR
jgi:hypothetical protein